MMNKTYYNSYYHEYEHSPEVVECSFNNKSKNNNNKT